jgi:hypothetical protein
MHGVARFARAPSGHPPARGRGGRRGAGHGRRGAARGRARGHRLMAIDDCLLLYACPVPETPASSASTWWSWVQDRPSFPRGGPAPRPPPLFQTQRRGDVQGKVRGRRGGWTQVGTAGTPGPPAIPAQRPRNARAVRGAAGVAPARLRLARHHVRGDRQARPAKV